MIIFEQGDTLELDFVNKKQYESIKELMLKHHNDIEEAAFEGVDGNGEYFMEAFVKRKERVE